MSTHCEEDLPLMPADFQASIRAIAHPVRREILQWLKAPLRHFPDQEYGQDLGVCVGQIVLRCGLSQSTVSGHVALLLSAGLVNQRKCGTVRFLQRNEACIRRLNVLLSRQLQAE